MGVRVDKISQTLYHPLTSTQIKKESIASTPASYPLKDRYYYGLAATVFSFFPVIPFRSGSCI